VTSLPHPLLPHSSSCPLRSPQFFIRLCVM
jgi:hypothetical protein